ncbi:hypothetical protein PUNSTDRAFT_141064 [Punctularia strigosozonata HHB-11173 SS5]|uniref:uncharacterized protein n=1 Tax=Punctularia strigosozonata (strain HHB-11173) TaxID=741275 RepID=UPI0004417660|nr:uncharacterized protein PUNSTDRAFT_141064 [Punctularia strigosozonata HHB-11173 SS5]EIN12311.1 hypothetical protein PUNSTDRAFT_141064 [Punctularia strigosozonata HHB-11173 SS5]
MPDLIPKPDPQTVKSRWLRDILEELNPDFPTEWHAMTYKMRVVIQKHLDPNKSMGQQNKDAVDQCAKEICEQITYFRQFEGAWPTLLYMEQYIVHNKGKNRIRGDLSGPWREPRLARNHIHEKRRRRRSSFSPFKSPKPIRRVVMPAAAKTQSDFIDLTTDSDDESRGTASCSAAAPRRRSLSPLRTRSRNVARSGASGLTAVDEDVKPSISAPPALEGKRRPVRPFVGKPRSPPAPYRPIGSSIGGPSQPASARANPVQAFLGNLDVPMGHLYPIFHDLGIREQAALDELARWDASERNAWLDGQLPSREEQGKITPFETHVVKRALMKRGEYLRASDKENKAP